MIHIRRLAAVDLVFLGPWVIIPEFALGVVGPLALGILTLRRTQSVPWALFGAYLVTLGINYVPLLFSAIHLVRDHTAHDEIADEIGDRQRLFRKYRRQSVWLLVPLLIPIVALAQLRHKTNTKPPSGGA